MAIGEVVYINSRKGMFVAATEDGDYCVIEIVDSEEVNLGDQIRGEIDE